MVAVVKQDSNFTGLRFIREPLANSSADVWLPLEPNSYKDFGANFKLVARTPINASRQRRKGVIVDLDAAGGWLSDLTYNNMQPWIEGQFFAHFRTKAELPVAAVDGAGQAYTVASGGTGFHAGDLLFAKGFAAAANNGLKTVGTATGTSVPVTGAALVTAAAQTGIISRAGFKFAVGDLNVNVAGTYPRLTATAKDLTQLGISPGEWIYVGGDTAITNFTNVANVGWVRIRDVSAGFMEFDKFEQPWALETAAAQTVEIFCGRVIQNELAASDGGLGIVQIPFQFERTLGAPDSSSPNVQAEYLTGALFNDLTITLNTADKITWDTTLIASGYQVEPAGSQKPGTRPQTTFGDAYNSTSHVRRFQLAIDSLNVPLFAYVSTGSLTINNNVKANKAVSVLGAFALTAGEFTVGGTVDAYFANVTATQAIPNNANCTVDLILAQENQGIAIDFPLLGLGNGLLKVTANEPITLPLSMDAATAASIDPNKNYTAMIVFFDYLPNAAM